MNIESDHTATDLNKHFHFEGLYFKRWRQKMLFFQTMKKVAFVLNSEKPKFPQEPTDTRTKEYESWVDNDFLCKKFVLNGLSDDLYD